MLNPLYKNQAEYMPREEFSVLKEKFWWSFVVRGLCCENWWCRARLEIRRIYQPSLSVDAHLVVGGE
jgi:hypothetical protein